MDIFLLCDYSNPEQNRWSQSHVGSTVMKRACIANKYMLFHLRILAKQAHDNVLHLESFQGIHDWNQTPEI